MSVFPVRSILGNAFPQSPTGYPQSPQCSEVTDVRTDVFGNKYSEITDVRTDVIGTKCSEVTDVHTEVFSDNILSAEIQGFT